MSGHAGVRAANPEKLQLMRQALTGDRDLPPSGKTLGLSFLAVEEGSTTIEMPVEDRFLNRGGGVQGGFLAALADAAMGSSLSTVTDLDESHATLEFKLNFLRPATKERGPLTATGHVLYRGRRFAHTEGEIRGKDGDLVAKATASWIIRKSPGGVPPDRE